MPKNACLTLSILAFGLVLGSPAAAQDALVNLAADLNNPDLTTGATDSQPACTGNLRVVNDISASAVISSFRDIEQTAQQVIYSRSECFNTQSNNRWKVDVAVSHLEGGGFESKSIALGIGGDFRPLKKAQAFSLSPVVRFSYDDLGNIGEQTSWGAELTAQYVFNLTEPLQLTVGDPKTDGSKSKKIYVAGTQVVAAARGAFNRRDLSLLANERQVDDQFLAFGMVGLDGRFRNKRLRWQGLLSYQTLDGSEIDGYVGLEASIRTITSDFQSYRHVYKISANFGKDYQAVIFSFGFRL